MKILHVQKVAGLAGSENHIIELLSGLVERGIKVEFLCLHDQADLNHTKLVTDRLENIGVRVHFLETESIFSLSYLNSIGKLIKTNNYHLVHSHLLYADLVIGLARFFNRIKTPQLSTKHGFDEEFINNHGLTFQHVGLSKYRLIAWFAEKFISRSIAVSEGLRNLFIGLRITDSNRINTVHHGFNSKLATSREKPYDIIVPGRLVKFKGHRFVIEAIKLIVNEYSDLKVKFIGTGSLMEELEKKVSNAGLSNTIEFMGFRNDVLELMRSSKMTIVPSAAEGFGLVILEAFSAYSSVIAFDVPACNEIIINNETGLLAKPFDTSELALKIKMLLDNSELRSSLTKNASESLSNYFNRSRMTDQTLDVYRSLLLE